MKKTARRWTALEARLVALNPKEAIVIALIFEGARRFYASQRRHKTTTVGGGERR